MNCPTCGYSMTSFDTQCPRCAQGIVQACAIACLVCQENNSVRRYACVRCDARLPTQLASIEKLSLKEYQKKATALGQAGQANKAVMVLKEAAEFYPQDLPTRQVLIGILERTGRHQEIVPVQSEIMTIQMKGSEAACLQFGDHAHLTGDVKRAVTIFFNATQFHPHSATLHERLAAAYEDDGDTDKATIEYRIVQRLRERQHQVQLQQNQKADGRAHTAETVGAVAGTAIGATGAAIGGGITILSLILGVVLVLFGVATCFFGVLLCITILGILPGLLILAVGVSICTAGFGVMAGGAALGATGGMLGILTGALTSGTALLHRSSRKNRNRT